MWTELQAADMARLPKQMLNGSVSPALELDNESLTIEAEGWKQCIDNLLAIRLLEDDWDGQGSPAPAPELVDSAIILAVLLRQKHVKPPNVTVQTVQASVHFHWQWPDTTMLEIDVVEPYVADVYFMPANRPCEHWQISEGVAV